MKKLMVLMLSLLLCACSTSENKEKETPKEDPKNENTTVSFVGVGDNLRTPESHYQQPFRIARQKSH